MTHATPHGITHRNGNAILQTTNRKDHTRNSASLNKLTLRTFEDEMKRLLKQKVRISLDMRNIC